MEGGTFLDPETWEPITLEQAMRRSSEIPVNDDPVELRDNVLAFVRPGAIPLRRHGDKPAVPMCWVIRNRVPEQGVGLLVGQWGTYKSFIALDMAAHITLGWDWTGEPIYKQGGVLIFAPEGAGSIAMRLEALVRHKLKAPQLSTNGDLSTNGIAPFGKRLFDPEHPPINVNIERLPIMWTSACPMLLGRDNPMLPMMKTIEMAKDTFRREHLPLSLILIDTLATAAGFKDENDNAEALRVLAGLRELSEQAEAVVLPVDHLGKVLEAGTRGASAKEANADFVLGILGEKELSGSVKNTRLTLRKLREAAVGGEIPFEAQRVNMGQDDHSNPVTSIVIDWRFGEKVRTDHWPTSIRPLRTAIANLVVAKKYSDQTPYDNGVIVKALDLEMVRAEFYASYPAEGDAKQKEKMRRMAFNRAMKTAQDLRAVGVRDVGATTYVWRMDEVEEPEPDGEPKGRGA